MLILKINFLSPFAVVFYSQLMAVPFSMVEGSNPFTDKKSESELIQKLSLDIIRLEKELINTKNLLKYSEEECPSACKDQLDKIESDVLENSLLIGKIATNLEDLRSDLEENVKNLNLNDSRIQKDLQEEMEGNREEFQIEIESINEKVDIIKEMPIGSIISWVLKPSVDADSEQSLPEGWMRCDGKYVSYLTISLL